MIQEVLEKLMKLSDAYDVLLREHGNEMADCGDHTLRVHAEKFVKPLLGTVMTRAACDQMGSQERSNLLATDTNELAESLLEFTRNPNVIVGIFVSDHTPFTPYQEYVN